MTRSCAVLAWVSFLATVSLFAGLTVRDRWTG
jgi:hypothetical protein